MPETHSSTVQEALALLGPLEAEQLQVARAMLQANDGALYPLDMLAIAAVNRSMAHIGGFRQMIEARNMICAGSLLRLQLDTAMRFSASWLAPDPHHFAQEVLKGRSIRKLKDRDGRLMTDAHLVAVLAKEDP